MQDIKVIDEGVIEYSKALKRQTEFFDQHHKMPNEALDVLLYCEHPHVYTLGKSGKEQNLLVSDDFLKKIGASFYKTDRGGDITYHGYGQLVGYPIINLQHFGIGLREYIYTMEEAIIRTIKEFGIEGFRVDTATGVWVNSNNGGQKKICAIGVKASRYVTMHGFALNVNTDLSYFNYINPCGFTTKGATSINEMCGTSIDMDDVKHHFSRHFKSLLFKQE
ncbi:MAG: lipoyl(octanoyl) transferase LipB [Rikenellaceae bacterium]